MMEYKGYCAAVVYDDEAELFHGEVVNTRDVITFQGGSVIELKHAFQESVDDYLDWCAERGERPDKPFSGRFHVRVSPELHRQVYLEAAQRGTSMNRLVALKLSRPLDDNNHVA